MKTQLVFYKPVFIYLLKFGGLFGFLYLLTLGIIGLSSPENHYSPFVDHYFNFIRPLRTSLLQAAKFFLSLFGFDAYLRDNYTLALSSGRAVRMVYSCIGYGVMCFWVAFVVANRGSLKKKIGWLLGGLISLWAINVLRVSLLLVALQQYRRVDFLGWDHHTWFTVAAYSLIFLMIYLYDHSFQFSSERTASILS